MAYTASLLSFVLENLNKTVVLTGSQIPISELRNDAVDNLLGSLIVAGTFLLPEVCVYFDNKLMRGNRSTKDSSSLLEAFNSPNMAPLARLDVNFAIEWNRVLRFSSGAFNVCQSLEANISFMTMSPLMNIKALGLVMMESKAVILAGYGMGNLPSNNKELMQTIREAIQRGVIVVIKTQCHRGSVNDVYETGRVLT
jgi:lysophospholipase